MLSLLSRSTLQIQLSEFQQKQCFGCLKSVWSIGFSILFEEIFSSRSSLSKFNFEASRHSNQPNRGIKSNPTSTGPEYQRVKEVKSTVYLIQAKKFGRSQLREVREIPQRRRRKPIQNQQQSRVAQNLFESRAFNTQQRLRSRNIHTSSVIKVI